MKYVGSSTKTVACDENIREATRNSPDVAPDVTNNFSLKAGKQW